MTHDVTPSTVQAQNQVSVQASPARGNRVSVPGSRPSSKKASPSPTPPPAVNVFSFTDYRAFLQAFYEEKHRRNPAYSMSAFTRRAGLGANSRGYLKLVIDGKRNLTPHSLRAFTDALGLEGREALYFENLVYFNQARTAKDKEYYFKRLDAASEGSRTEQFDLLKSQYAYCTHWYLVAVRELVDLADFQEDPSWIASRLRGKITRKQASEALEHLERMGLVRRGETGKLAQSQPLVKFPGGTFNVVIQNFHLQMMELARESLQSDEYQDRNASAVTLSCDSARLPQIIEAVNRFRDQLTTEFGVGSARPDSVIQLNFQVFQLTTPSPKKEIRK